MEKIFYQISDPTQNVPEGDDSWIAQLKQENIMCDCGNIIKHTAIDVFLNEKIKKSFAPITYARGTFIGMLHKDIVSLLGIQNIENVFFGYSFIYIINLSYKIYILNILNAQ